MISVPFKPFTGEFAVSWKCRTNLQKFENEKKFRLWNRVLSRYGFSPHLAKQFYTEENHKDNLLMIGGASCLWQCLLGQGTATTAQTLSYFDNTNAYLGAGDSSTAAADTQTDLQASSNKVRVAQDSSYPLSYDGVATKTITGATNATPIVITASSHGYSTGDGVYIESVAGNTAANGVWIIDVVNSNSFSLRGSVGSGSYTSGGQVTRNMTVVYKSTFGSAVGNFAWAEWGLFNGSSGGRMLNRKVVSQGTKASPAIWTFSVVLGIA